VPLIQTLQQSFVADRVEGFRGILNGTTNFILSTMAARPAAAYGDVLGEAQRLGFAEADPSADVDGHDVHAKLVLCVRLALGYRFAADERPPRYGIAQVTQADLAYGRDRLRATVKLLGACARLPAHCSGDADADVFTAHVAPAFVPLDSAWARVEGPGNAVQLRSQHLADGLWLGGPGAGRLPTANAVLADLCATAQAARVAPALPPAAFPPLAAGRPLRFTDNFVAAFYVRVFLATRDGAAARGPAASALVATAAAAAAAAGVALQRVEIVRDAAGGDALLALLTAPHTTHARVVALRDALLRDAADALDASRGALLLTVATA
jgi:hypothetical protein